MSYERFCSRLIARSKKKSAPLGATDNRQVWIEFSLCVRDWSGILCEIMGFGIRERGLGNLEIFLSEEETKSEQRYSGKPDGLSRNAQKRKTKDKGLKSNGSEELCFPVVDIKKSSRYIPLLSILIKDSKFT